MSKVKFLRQDAHRFKRLGKKWRRPKGLQSKLKRKIRGAGNYPTPGHRAPKATRNLHPSGKREVMVCNIEELKKLDETVVVRIAATVGQKKRKEIQEEAKKMKIRILNPKVIEAKKKKVKEIKDKKTEGKKETPKEEKVEKKPEEKKEEKEVKK